MRLSSHATVVSVDFGRIRENFRFLNQLRTQAQGGRAFEYIRESYGISLSPILAVVKSDAYGHGHVATAEALIQEGAAAFASGGIGEASMLRLALAEKNAFPEIFSLLGPVGPGDFVQAARNRIIPLIHDFHQFEVLREELAELEGMADEGKRPLLPVAIKCNSGMSRLGFDQDALPELIEALKAFPILTPIAAFSHFACADSPDGPDQMKVQAKRFAAMLDQLRGHWSLVPSLCNSAGTLLSDYVDPIIGPQMCRTGVSLYGINPLADTPYAARGQKLRPAMTVSAPIIAVRKLAAGKPIGYGFSWTADRDTEVAIMACGYADFFSRGLSNQGQVCVNGTRAKVLGRVAMQMTALDVSGAAAKGITVKPGDRAWILGGEGPAAITPEDLAGFWQSIPYEVLCLLGMNARP